MRKNSTIIRNKKTVNFLIGILAVSVLFFVGCYEFKTINQPDEAFVNSYFDVPIVVHDDGNPDNDWTVPDLQNIGLFGVMIPDGWTVQDSIHYYIISTDPTVSNDGYLVYNFSHTITLEDSIPSIDGYHWWGAITADTADMYLFDSLYFEPRIMTNDVAGTFYLRYAVGDKDYWDRNPADDLSDPLPITIIDNTGIDEMLSNANVSVFPNPTSGQLNINFDNYGSQVIDMQVLDIKGNIVLSKQLFSSKNTFDLSTFSKGMYFVRLQNGKKHFSNHKIILR